MGKGSNLEYGNPANLLQAQCITFRVWSLRRLLSIASVVSPADVGGLFQRTDTPE